MLDTIFIVEAKTRITTFVICLVFPILYIHIENSVIYIVSSTIHLAVHITLIVFCAIF